VGETELFLGVNMRGARASGTRSSLAAVPLSGGAPVELLGTAAFGVEISGMTVFRDVIYFSRIGGPNLRDSGVFRYSNGESMLVTTDPMSAPAGLVLNSAGDLHFADANSGSVRRLSGGTTNNYAGRGPCGDRIPPIAGLATEAALCGPQLLAISMTGDLYIAGRGTTWIVEVDSAGMMSVFVKDFGPSSLAVDASGALLAAAGSRLVRFEATGMPTTIADHLAAVLAIAVGGDDSIYVLHQLVTTGATRSLVTKLRRV